MEIQYYKVLGEGLKTREGFQWKPGEWNTEPNAVMDGQVCGIGLHVWKNRPQYRYITYLPDHTYRVIDVDGLCGEDGEKSRFRRVKLATLPMTLEEILGPEKDGLSYANLIGANLSGANLSEANLSRADLSRADLSEADLSGANLSGANLYWADLSRANLSEANLYWANLSGATLYLADLSGANLYWADLSGAHGCMQNAFLSDRQREQAHC